MTIEQWTEVFEEVAPFGMMLEDAATAVLTAIVERTTDQDIAEFERGHSLTLAAALEAAREHLGMEGDENPVLEFPKEDDCRAYMQGWLGIFVAFEIEV